MTQWLVSYDKCLKNKKDTCLRHKYTTDKKKRDESIKFKEQVKVYIFVARWPDSLSVNEKGIYFISGSTAQLLVSWDFRATKPPQRIYLENLCS